MGRALKLIFRLGVLAALVLVGYAMVADLPPPTREVVVDLTGPAKPAQ